MSNDESKTEPPKLPLDFARCCGSRLLSEGEHSAECCFRDNCLRYLNRERTHGRTPFLTEEAALPDDPCSSYIPWKGKA